MMIRYGAMIVLTGLAMVMAVAPASANVVASAVMSVSVTVAPGCGTADCQSGNRVVKQVVVQKGVAGDSANPPPSSTAVTRMMVVSY